MTILVTGATGNIGREVVRQLVAADRPVRALTRDPEKAATTLGEGVEIVKGDLQRPETLAEALEGVDKLFLLVDAHTHAATVGPVLDAAKRAGVRHVVQVSSSTVAMDPPVTIGRWHLQGERLLQASGLAWTLLRPGNLASNALRWAGSIRAQGAVYGTTGSGPSAPIDPRDIGAVGAQALMNAGHEGQIYLLTGPVRITAADQVAILADVLGKPIRYVEIPDAQARAGMVRSGMPEAMIDPLVELLAAVKTGQYAHQTSTVRDVTGVEARTFERWARDHAAAF